MGLAWVLLALFYLAGLFWLARWGERNSTKAKRFSSHPAIYSLALAIYCTAWTFYGSVGEASRTNWNYLPILLGPILLYLFGYRFIYKLALVSKKQHITTIADFISSRYGKRQNVALMVTLIALLATIPYIALQLKAIGSAFIIISGQVNGQLVIFLAASSIATFSILFGTKQTDVTEYRRGLMLAIAFESSIKLIALVVVAIVGFTLWQHQSSSALFSNLTSNEALATFQTGSFWGQTLMAAAAVICLPRQFHVAIVDNLSLEHLKTARWLFPLYLAITAVTIPIIASAGQELFAQTNIEPDTYVLNIAVFSDSLLLQCLVFIGGLSAATAMIIVATLTLSTMLTNDVIMPKLLVNNHFDKGSLDYTNKILHIRRWVIGAILLLAFFYQQQIANTSSLSSIGLLAFSLVVQLLPAIVGGLYWKRGHAQGVYAGFITGIGSWILWLIVPSIDSSVSSALQSEDITRGAILSLAVNCLAYIVFSLLARPRLADKIQALAFVAPKEAMSGRTKRRLGKTQAIDLLTLMTTFMGESRCQQLLADYQFNSGNTVEPNEPPDQEFLSFCERALGGVLGASTAKALLDSALNGRKLDFEEVANVFDETTQAMQFNMSALLISLESIDQGISVVDKDLNLVAWNKRYVDLFDYPDSLVSIGTPIEKLVRYNAQRGECGLGEIDELVSKRLEHMRLGHAHRFIRQRSDGKMIEMVGNPLPGGGFVTSFSDVTEHIEIQKALKEANIDLQIRVQKRSEEVQAINAELHKEIARRAELEVELTKAMKLAEQANHSKTHFLAMASHDILQPLNAAKLYLSALNEMAKPQEVDTIIEKLAESIGSSETLIGTLLDIARLDQGGLQAKIGLYSFLDIVNPLLDETKMMAAKKQLKFRIRLADAWIYTDRTYLYRIVQNLLSNAVKYTESGSILFSARIRQGKLLIQVWDSGLGISVEQQKQVFNDFYRVSNHKEHGMGLGLGVVSRLADKIEANISLTSKFGKGSVFSFSLPLGTESHEVCKTPPPMASTPSNMLALCIDDKQENLDAMQTLLSKWQIKSVIANTVEQAKKQFEQAKPQVLLVDYQLEDSINGIELIMLLRQQCGSNLPALLISANQEDEIKQACIEQHITYLSKPIKPARLRAFLASVVGT
jgi:Na+/proline symporter/signal transduction histidine kinase/CheY-like chemotaxis protein